jgi:hypothetical protein
MPPIMIGTKFMLAQAASGNRPHASFHPSGKHGYARAKTKRGILREC